MTENQEKWVRDAWAFLRKNNNDIPDFILDLMRDAALEKIAHTERIKGLTCPNCQHDGDIWGTVLIRGGIEVEQIRGTREGTASFTKMIFKCDACEWEWG